MFAFRLFIVFGYFFCVCKYCSIVYFFMKRITYILEHKVDHHRLWCHCPLQYIMCLIIIPKNLPYITITASHQSFSFVQYGQADGVGEKLIFARGDRLPPLRPQNAVSVRARVCKCISVWLGCRLDATFFYRSTEKVHLKLFSNRVSIILYSIYTYIRRGNYNL